MKEVLRSCLAIACAATSFLCASCTATTSSPSVPSCDDTACTDGGANDSEDAPTGCLYDNSVYSPGDSFEAKDGCGICTCTSAGELSCPDAQCTDAGHGDTGQSCSIAATYVYGPVGGDLPFHDTVTLSPPSSYALVRTSVPGDSDPNDNGSCTPALPPCGDPSVVNLSTINADLADPAVQALLDSTMTRSIMVGFPATPDDPVFSIQRNGTAGFLVGSPCPEALTDCTPVPPAVSKLVADLTTLNRLALMDPSCP